MSALSKTVKNPGGAPDAAGKPARKHMSRGSAIALGAFSAYLIVMAVALLLPLVLTLQPSYYQAFPSLSGRIAAWRESTHSLVGCSDCHVDPGPAGVLAFAERSIPAFYSQLISGPTTQNVLAVPSAAACLKCHKADRTVSPNGDLLIPHQKHVVELGMACAVCHKNLVHSPNSQGFNTPEMPTCLVAGCHDGIKAKNDCVTCHTQIQVPPDHKNADWLTVHSTFVGKIDCAKCHAWTPNFCQACHEQRPASHVGNWKFEHQFAANRLGTKGCLVCHDQKTFCDTCH
jgi:hypothetical protein